uniref:Retrovirus-related Pol polyprotein from transposon TNT 1-94-like beta-barrel domain-containing protein n=1 Tax=Tanacetum cinerariifolium TaxID=118510 RepID=A0A6L2L7P1_TANCI|nr:hypothetical protein [Tanacetum cinerariifolium]
MNVEDLVVRLCIEEDKLSQKDTYTPDSVKANMLEHAGSSLRNMKQKFQGTCYNCDQPGHHAGNYKMLKRVNPRQAYMVNDNTDMIAVVSDVVAMISEVNLVAADNRENLYTDNSATADIKGEGYVILKMTSKKELKLTNVLYILEIRKNLVSGWLLNKFGFRLF